MSVIDLTAEVAALKQREADALGDGLNTNRLETWTDNVASLISLLRREGRHFEAAWWSRAFADMVADRCDVILGEPPKRALSCREDAMDRKQGQLRQAIREDETRLLSAEPRAFPCSPNTIINARQNCLKAFS